MMVSTVRASMLGNSALNSAAPGALLAAPENSCHMVTMSAAGLPVRLMTLALAGAGEGEGEAEGEAGAWQGLVGHADSALMGLLTVLRTMLGAVGALLSTDSLTLPVAAQPM
jgi:hypothetical protein